MNRAWRWVSRWSRREINRRWQWVSRWSGREIYRWRRRVSRIRVAGNWNWYVGDEKGASRWKWVNRTGRRVSRIRMTGTGIKFWGGNRDFRSGYKIKGTWRRINRRRNMRWIGRNWSMWANTRQRGANWTRTRAHRMRWGVIWKFVIERWTRTNAG